MASIDCDMIVYRIEDGRMRPTPQPHQRLQWRNQRATRDPDGCPATGGLVLQRSPPANCNSSILASSSLREFADLMMQDAYHLGSSSLRLPRALRARNRDQQHDADPWGKNCQVHPQSYTANLIVGRLSGRAHGSQCRRRKEIVVDLTITCDLQLAAVNG